MITKIIRYIINVIRRLFNNPDCSGRLNVIDVALYLIQLSLKRNKFLDINQLTLLLLIIQKNYLEHKNFALFKEDFILDNRNRLSIKEVSNYFCGFGIMDLFYPEDSEVNISKSYKEEIEMLFDLYIDRVKSDKFKNQVNFLLKSFNSDSKFHKNFILYNLKI